MRYILSSIIIVLCILAVALAVENILGEFKWYLFFPSVIYLILVITIIQFLINKNK